MPYDQNTLRQMRESQPRKLTQADVAKALGITGGAYAKKESGDVPITVAELVTVADLYGVPPACFFGENGSEKEDDLNKEIIELSRLVGKLSLKISEKDDLIEQLKQEIENLNNPQ